MNRLSDVWNSGRFVRPVPNAMNTAAASKALKPSNVRPES